MDFDALKQALIIGLNASWEDVRALVACTSGTDGMKQSIGECYLKSDALAAGYGICILLIIYSFVWSIIGQNCSKVDQIWSIAPVLYCWHFYAHYAVSHTDGPMHVRLLLLCALVTLWGIRLTYNFWRKGGYGTFFVHEEDYRWPILRAKMHPFVFLLFNFSFIAVYQNLLLYWIAVPAYEVMRSSPNLTLFDLSIGCTFAALLVMETLADEQHWVFQSYKHSLSPSERRNHSDPQIQQGFYRSGLFRYSRHPNYFAEQSMWVCVYLFTLSSAWNTSSIPTTLEAYVNWTCLGCIQLILLFQGSMNFGESITLSKYPEYAAYQRTTSQCIPLPPWSDKEKKH